MDKKRFCVAIDQSYSCSGFSVWANGELKLAQCLKPSGDNTEKRAQIVERLESLIRKCMSYPNTDVLCEAVRTQGMQGTSPALIKAQSGLVIAIVDMCYKFNIEVYSCNTAAWKSKVVGTSKPLENEYGINPRKFPTIKHCIEQGYGSLIMEDPGKRKKGLITSKQGKVGWPNDNIADAICIGEYYFKDGAKLHKEY